MAYEALYLLGDASTKQMRTERVCRHMARSLQDKLSQAARAHVLLREGVGEAHVHHGRR